MTKDDEGYKLTFEEALENLLNQYGEDNKANTPDYILAEYLTDCLDAYVYALDRKKRHEEM